MRYLPIPVRSLSIKRPGELFPVAPGSRRRSPHFGGLPLLSRSCLFVSEPAATDDAAEIAKVNALAASRLASRRSQNPDDRPLPRAG